jgi:hypothetical protein
MHHSSASEHFNEQNLERPLIDLSTVRHVINMLNRQEVSSTVHALVDLEVQLMTSRDRSGQNFNSANFRSMHCLTSRILWIVRHGRLEWPPLLPDLTPLGPSEVCRLHRSTKKYSGLAEYDRQGCGKSPWTWRGGCKLLLYFMSTTALKLPAKNFSIA